MTAQTRVNLSNALILALLGFAVVESTAIASQGSTKRQTTQERRIAEPSAPAARVRANRVQPQPIAVVRKGSPTIVFTNDAAIANQLTLTQKEIWGFEAALAKDLAHGDFHAPHTRRVVRAGRRPVAASTAEKLGSARRELCRLREALREDLADGKFDGPHTRAEVSKRNPAPQGVGEDDLADGTVAVTDGIWNLEMAIEKDLHAHAFTAIETHFNIDGRRWKVR